MNEVKKLLGLDDKNIKILSIEEEQIKGKKVKIVNAISITEKVKCPILGRIGMKNMMYLIC